jgi:hypothetical protein
LVSTTALPSERKFGLLMAGVFFFVGCYGVFKSGAFATIAAFFTSAGIFLLLALVAPGILRPLNRAWFAMGMLMGKVVSPVVLGGIFFLLITPVAVVTRMFGRDQLKLAHKRTDSYWIAREPAGPDAESFKNQF